MTEWDLTNGELANLMEQGLNHDCRMSALAARRLVADAARDRVLGALKAKGIRLGDIDWHTWMDAAKELGRRQFWSPGCLTFIPDEETK